MMICCICKKIVDEDKLFVGMYMDVAKWIVTEDEDSYEIETSKYLAISHLPCLQASTVEPFLESTKKEFPEFKRRAKGVLRETPEKRPRLKLVDGQKK